MKKVCLALISVLVLGCNAPKEVTTKKYSVNQFMDIVQINGGSFSPDESKLVYNSKSTDRKSVV